MLVCGLKALISQTSRLAKDSLRDFENSEGTDSSIAKEVSVRQGASDSP